MRRRRSTTGRPLAAPLALALALAVGAGCGGEGVSSERLDAIRVALDADPSRALALVHEAAADDGPTPPRLALLGAEACLRLERRDDALDWAARGLEASDLDEGLACELLWAQGAALMGRYQELHAEADRRLANTVLERATAAGPRVADAAFLLVYLQDLGGTPDTERQLRYARLFLAREPDSARAAQLRAHLEGKGLRP